MRIENLKLREMFPQRSNTIDALRVLADCGAKACKSTVRTPKHARAQSEHLFFAIHQDDLFIPVHPYTCSCILLCLRPCITKVGSGTLHNIIPRFTELDFILLRIAGCTGIARSRAPGCTGLDQDRLSRVCV